MYESFDYPLLSPNGSTFQKEFKHHSNIKNMKTPQLIKWLVTPLIYKSLALICKMARKIKLVQIIVRMTNGEINHEDACGSKNEVTRAEGRLQNIT